VHQIQAKIRALLQEALMPGGLRDRGRAGGPYPKATRYTDDGRFGVPPGRSGAFPAADEPDRVMPVAGPASGLIQSLLPAIAK
jgi:hypothetical protein